jgi:hypothetical protein
MLTLFLYLNDVEEGGGTHFPLLDITIQPKKGNAVIWPSVLDDKPETKDPRTDHEALPVINGIKYVSTSVWRWRSRCSMHNSYEILSLLHHRERMLGYTLETTKPRKRMAVHKRR